MQQDLLENNQEQLRYVPNYGIKSFNTYAEVKSFFNLLNDDCHMTSRDDICTPLECVKTMLDYVPDELWKRNNLKVLDPCAGNGNFGAYAALKTSLDNIYFNEINHARYINCLNTLNPKHISNIDAFSLSENSSKKYDLVMANPPYSGGGNKNQSLSNEFIRLGISLLKDKGYLCYITPNNWMTYNNSNETLHELLQMGSFLAIDNDAKKYFQGVGSSFTIFVWQKGVFNHKTFVKNNFLVKDVKKNVIIPADIPFIPLYISNPILSVISKSIKGENNRFKYRCDLHNYTRKDLLSDTQSEIYKYPTIHTVRKLRYASIKQDIFDKYIIIIPLSTYYVPYIVKGYNTTQSVGYVAFSEKKDADTFLTRMTEDIYKVIVHITRYGNFNNIKVLKNIDFDDEIRLTKSEREDISRLAAKIKY